MMFVNFSMRNAVRCSTASRLVFKATPGFFSYNNNWCDIIRTTSSLALVCNNLNFRCNNNAYQSNFCVRNKTSRTSHDCAASCDTQNKNVYISRERDTVDALEKQWEKNFALLEKFNEKEGHCNVPQYYKESDENLGRWLDTQRSEKRKGVLDDVKEERLEELGVIWGPFSHQWEEMFALLTKFNQKHGHYNVPRNHKESDENLGEWLGTQRKNRKKGILDDGRERRLEMVGVIWEPFAQQWEEMFALLEKFKQKHEHCDVPVIYKVDGESLGAWLGTQRQNKKNGILDNVREKRLTKLGVIIDPITHQWEKMFTLLETFKQKHGHCNVPQRHKEEGQNLGFWLSHQRHRILDNVQEKRLTKLGVVMDPITHQWEKMFTLLETFKQKHGHCNVPQRHKEEGQNLGMWLSHQRHRILDNVQEKRLTKLGVVMDPITHQWEKNVYTS